MRCLATIVTAGVAWIRENDALSFRPDSDAGTDSDGDIDESAQGLYHVGEQRDIMRRGVQLRANDELHRAANAAATGCAKYTLDLVRGAMRCVCLTRM